MATKGQMTDMFKQLEEVMNKCDSLSHELKEVKKEHKKEIKNLKKDFKREKDELNEQIDKLEKKVDKLERENEKLRNDNDRLKGIINKTSDNSSKPPSTDIKKKIVNNREKSTNKNGGQFGHKGHYLSRKKIEEKIKNKAVQHEVVNHGVVSERVKYKTKYEITSKLIVIVKEHRFYPDENGKYNIDKKYKNDVIYGDEIKAICSYLSVEDSMPLNKIVSTIAAFSNNEIKLSEGTIVNFINEISEKASVSIKELTEELLSTSQMYTDETGTKCNGKRYSVRNYSTNDIAIYKSNRYKNKESIEQSNILNRYTGDIIHDHETVIYNYGNRHIECNVHISRYLKGNTENTTNVWSVKMRELFNRLNNSRKIALEYGQIYFEKEDILRYENEYDEILNIGFSENKKTTSKIYKKEEKKLLNRLKKYKENHLLFIHDFSLPFDNNTSERDIRVYKTKTKVSGGFRSEDGLTNFTNILSIVKTARKRHLNVFNILTSIYKETTAVFS